MIPSLRIYRTGIYNTIRIQFSFEVTAYKNAVNTIMYSPWEEALKKLKRYNKNKKTTLLSVVEEN
jgi:hypothetical protein